MNPPRITAILLALLAFAGCDKSPAGPGKQQPGTPVVSGLDMTAPPSLPPGTARQFQAFARYTDGSRREATSQASWTTLDASILSVSPAGLVTANKRGETEVRATLAGFIIGNRVRVLPDGTFRLSGTVEDVDRPVGGARVEVISGPAAGLTTFSQSNGISQSNGTYALYGVSGPAQIRTTHPDYQTSLQSVDVTVDRTMRIELVRLFALWDPSGRYSLTITAAPECQATLPEDAWKRTYTATVTLTSNPRYLQVRVEGVNPMFANTFYGILGETAVSSTLVDFDTYYGTPDIAEVLAPMRYFIPSGSLQLPRTEGGLFEAGRLDGKLEVRSGPDPRRSTLIASCGSTNHRFAFAR